MLKMYNLTITNLLIIKVQIGYRIKNLYKLHKCNQVRTEKKIMLKQTFRKIILLNRITQHSLIGNNKYHITKIKKQRYQKEFNKNF